MPNNSSLSKYYKEDEFNSFIINKINSIFKKIEKNSNILLLGNINQSKIINNNSLNIKYFTFNYNDKKIVNKKEIDKTINDFFSFSKKNKLNFDYIFDISFITHIKIQRINNYMKQLSKFSNYKTDYYLITLSNDSSYCKNHCPKRLWTYKDDIYFRYFKKNQLKRTIENKFKIQEINAISFSIDDYVYFEINAVMTNKKLN
jgi:hypothetical protein